MEKNKNMKPYFLCRELQAPVNLNAPLSVSEEFLKEFVAEDDQEAVEAPSGGPSSGGGGAGSLTFEDAFEGGESTRVARTISARTRWLLASTASKTRSKTWPTGRPNWPTRSAAGTITSTHSALKSRSMKRSMSIPRPHRMWPTPRSFSACATSPTTSATLRSAISYGTHWARTER